jgi:protein-tyrosine-phosphatase
VSGFFKTTKGKLMFRSILLAAAITAASFMPAQAQSVGDCNDISYLAESAAILRDQGISLEAIAAQLVTNTDLSGDDLAVVLEFLSTAYNMNLRPGETRRLFLSLCLSSLS